MQVVNLAENFKTAVKFKKNNEVYVEIIKLKILSCIWYIERTGVAWPYDSEQNTVIITLKVRMEHYPELKLTAAILDTWNNKHLNSYWDPGPTAGLLETALGLGIIALLNSDWI